MTTPAPETSASEDLREVPGYECKITWLGEVFDFDGAEVPWDRSHADGQPRVRVTRVEKDGRRVRLPVRVTVLLAKAYWPGSGPHDMAVAWDDPANPMADTVEWKPYVPESRTPTSSQSTKSPRTDAKACKHCGAAIRFITAKGRTRAINVDGPSPGRSHRCRTRGSRRP